MTPHRNKRRKESTKEAVRRAAAELFAEKGFAATSTREICQRAGITKPVLYYHFGDKHHLYEELVLDAFSEYQRAVRRAARRGRTAREKLIDILGAMFVYARKNSALYRVGLRMVFAPEKETPDIDYMEFAQADEKLLTEVVRQGIRRGEMKGHAEQIGGAIHGIATACSMGFMLTGQPRMDRSTARDIIDFLMEGCGKKSTRR
jgi:TetR/AcrR family transcriptional regulator